MTNEMFVFLIKKIISLRSQFRRTELLKQYFLAEKATKVLFKIEQISGNHAIKNSRKEPMPPT